VNSIVDEGAPDEPAMQALGSLDAFASFVVNVEKSLRVRQTRPARS
jgi:hypothetical protein